MMDRVVDLIVPVKRLDRAKSRLRGVIAEHDELVLALLLDTVTAAAGTPGVGRVLVICEDERVSAALHDTGIDHIDHIDQRGLPGLNPALQFGADQLRAADPRSVIGALQADLPALRPTELAEVLAEADNRRAFCADRQGTGTTLLLSAPGQPLDPRFGPGSARAHESSGALPITTPAPSLRCDVDTAEDLAVATNLGVGPRTSTLVCCVTPR
jgi:2-phospho-L-lactate guanylyltransferase